MSSRARSATKMTYMQKSSNAYEERERLRSEISRARTTLSSAASESRCSNREIRELFLDFARSERRVHVCVCSSIFLFSSGYVALSL